MSLMTYATPLWRGQSADSAASRAWTAIRGALSGLLYVTANAIHRSRARRSRAELNRHVADRGLTLTDSAERDLETRLMFGGWNVRR